ncbi:response regulator transcription factor [Bacillaceae bacterium S4-13-58]
MTSTILIIDDDHKIAAMMRRGLTFEGYNVLVSHSGKEGLLQLLEENVDLVILDIMMPGIDGIEVCRRIRKEDNIPVLMVTAKDAVSDRVTGFEMGADDYLIKPFAFEELVARVKALLRRVSTGGEQTLDFIVFSDLTLDTAGHVAIRKGREIELSTTEYNLLKIFMDNPRRILSRDLIMEKVWGYDFSGESNVLEVYVGYLRNKLESQDEKRLIHTVRGSGYVLKE